MINLIKFPETIESEISKISAEFEGSKEELVRHCVWFGVKNSESLLLPGMQKTIRKQQEYIVELQKIIMNFSSDLGYLGDSHGATRIREAVHRAWMAYITMERASCD